jgi:hypothetical protein
MIIGATSPSKATNGRTALIREAFRLEYITLAWMTIEAAGGDRLRHCRR